MSLTKTVRRTDVLVIGAGMAGLSAARILAEHGKVVTVLEARDHVGGRILTERTPEGVLVEHGAEFVHGKPPELWALIEEIGAETVERDGAMLSMEHPDDPLEEDEGEDEASTSALDQLINLPGEDQAFADWLEQSSIPEARRQDLIGYVEGFNAADARIISAKSLGIQQSADEAIDGDRAWHLPGGYAQLPAYLAARIQEKDGELRLGCRVFAIHWRPTEVVVTTSQGELRAPKCVITLPLGVLHAANASAPESVRIDPEPKPLFEARRLAMGQVVRFTLIFRERWWENARPGALDAEDMRTLSFLFTRQRQPPVWWTRHPEPEPLPTLVGWCGGPRSEALRNKTAAELGDLACRELAEVFEVPESSLRALLIGTYTYDWSADRYARGAYSYVRAGAVDASEAMARPEANTLYFAGEHTDTTGHWGTVHAAMRSGLRAASQILQETTHDSTPNP